MLWHFTILSILVYQKYDVHLSQKSNKLKQEGIILQPLTVLISFNNLLIIFGHTQHFGF